MKTSRDFDHAHLGDSLTSRDRHFWANRAQNLTILSLAISEKFKGCKILKMDHVTLVTPLSETVGRPKANNIDTACKHTTFDDASFSRSWGVKF